MHVAVAARRIIVPALLIAALVMAAGCTGSPAPVPAGTASENPAPEQPAAVPQTVSPDSWKNTGLVDLGGRGNFTIAGFSGRAVIVTVVASSCPVCIPQLNRQVGEAAGAQRIVPGYADLVVLDLDPAGGPDFLSAYGGRTNFTGWSARAPPAMAGLIFSRFGPFAVDTTTEPVILACRNGHDILLPPGLKNATALSAAIVREC